MKTLDEVIKAKELCNDHFRCHECSYYDDDNEVGCRSDELDADALHYLKEYRETVTNCNQMRTGIWIPVDSETVNGKCSVCGYESHLYENDVYGEHYCPNCGAWLRLK